jgi:hypothetical protein
MRKASLGSKICSFLAFASSEDRLLAFSSSALTSASSCAFHLKTGLSRVCQA